MRSLKALTWFLLLSTFLKGQRENPHYQYARQLILSHDHKNAHHILHFDKIKFSIDTADFLLGYNHHFLKQLDSAIFYFDKIKAPSEFFHQSRAYHALNAMFKKDYPAAGNILAEAIQKTGGSTQQLFILEDAANALLQRNYGLFDSVALRFAYDNFLYSSEQKYLVDIRQSLMKERPKSPALAGLLSAVLPGAGKFYAGKKGAALASFMTNAVLAGFALESYYRAGYKSPQFIGFGTVFMCFYAGNIMGSVYSVKQQIRSRNGKINNEILATIHIPVDRVFGR